MDFFDKACQSGPFTAPQFGLCDDQNSTIAYVDLQNPGKWTATVDNSGQKQVMFTAIDKCVIKDGEHEGRGRCDGMLTTADLLYLVELKDMHKGWIAGATAQLESTIQFLLANHDLTTFRHKKAFACNKKHPGFAQIDHEQKLRFFRQYGFRIDVQATVLII